MLVRLYGGRYFNIGAHIHVISHLAVVTIVFTDIGNVGKCFENSAPVPFILKRLSACSADMGWRQ